MTNTYMTTFKSIKVYAISILITSIIILYLFSIL
nr:MAG TPA: hypothetical protein [Caudoviricetes sp.]DAX21738.1 MAG TPA: hypothetical protein [Caudoviricetes sp.]